jgi:hypothetical protein
MEQTTSTTEAVATPAVETTPKAPSKKSLAVAIFNARLLERSQGLFATNKAFRAIVLSDIQSQLSVSVASAATMYNAAKKDAEGTGTVTLGRDPKIVKVKTNSGKRGRPVGSKNRPKEEVAPVVTTEVSPEAPASTEAVAVEAAPAV